MSDVKVYTQYDPPPTYLEIFEDEGKVERTGYLPTEVLVEQFLLAGQQLVAFRNAEYGPEDEISDDVVPTKLDYTRIDAAFEAYGIRRRASAKQVALAQEAADAEAKAIADAEAKAREVAAPVPGVSPDVPN